ncbi:hypothetical protein NDI39_24960 [Microcoleus sp. ZQ-A2]|nr:hypothetical protein [Microcoleus sp. FACHB-1]
MCLTAVGRQACIVATGFRGNLSERHSLRVLGGSKAGFPPGTSLSQRKVQEGRRQKKEGSYAPIVTGL